MPDAVAFPGSQSEYAFPAGQGEGPDEVEQAQQRNQQIQAAFDAQRFQRGFMQALGKNIAQLQQRQAQQKG